MDAWSIFSGQTITSTGCKFSDVVWIRNWRFDGDTKWILILLIS